MPVEFLLEPTGSSSDTTRLVMMYDGSGRRISKALLTKSAATTSWDMVKVTLSQPSDKVTENFTGKERDDETKLNYFGARYLDPMLGMWISVDPARQFASPYLYAGNGMNPLSHYDANGNYMIRKRAGKYEIRPMSKWSAISGALFRDVPGAIMSVLPNPLIQKLGLAWGVLKSKAQNSYASTTISTIASKGVDKAFVDEINVNGEISYPEYICK